MEPRKDQKISNGLSFRLHYIGNKTAFFYSYPYGIVKRAVNSMDDCFDTMDEPLYGFRTKVTSEKTCGAFGTNCDLSKAVKESILQERQTGEEFRSDAPKDCRIINQCL